jgi:potassium efflux system protein
MFPCDSVRRRCEGPFMKKLIGRTLALLVGISFLTMPLPASTQASGTRVTQDLLQNRIAAAQADIELDEAGKTRLIDLYRQSVSNLENTRANREATEEYRQAMQTAPAEAEKVRATIERRRTSDPALSLKISSSTDTMDLVFKLDEELANLAAVEANLKIVGAEIASQAQRPTEIRARITAARSLMDGLTTHSADTRAPGATSQLAEAAAWAAETQLEALQTEIVMLDQELLSSAARRDLLNALRDEATQNVDRISQRIVTLREAISERRRLEGERTMEQAQAAVEEASADQPLMLELAKGNLALVELLQEQVVQLDELAARETSRPRASQIEDAYRGARRKLELVGSKAPVGLAIIEERQRFPRARAYAAERRLLSSSITAVSLRLIEAEEEFEALSDVSAYTNRRIAEAAQRPPEDSARKELESLVQTRRSLLARAIDNDRILQRRLHDLDDALRRLAERTTEYDAFLDERLLWVRSTRSVGTGTLASLPSEILRYLSPGPWLTSAWLTALGLMQTPVFSLILIAAAVLISRRQIHGAALVDWGRNVGRVKKDSMSATFAALAYTLVLAAPVPLIFAALGGALESADRADPFSHSVGTALSQSAMWLAFLLSLRSLFRKDGVAERHFGWNAAVLKSLKGQLSWFVVLAVPVNFVLFTSGAVAQGPANIGGALTLLSFIVLMAGLVVLAFRIGHPTKGSVGLLLADRPQSAWWRWRHVWFPIALLLPITLIALALFGFAYTAVQLAQPLFQTIWLLTILCLGAALVRRWLLMTNRRLAFDEALTARAQRARESTDAAAEPVGEDDIGAEEVDLVALDAESRKLLNATLLLAVVVGLVGIWHDLMPALGILESVNLWNKRVLVEGVEQLAPVTLADLFLVLVIGYTLTTNLPSLLQIILLKQGSVSAGGRYAVETLTRYTIIALTGVLMLGLMGVNASQLGWMAAALGVGIGFGVQEIVANFVCGLILLFERPVRVGDVITIGDASGVVLKIRIRATTIRDWELKELIIPNKELITGRMLNWSLSDSVTRVLITVGVAYGSDTKRAMALMQEAAMQNARVLSNPEPVVHFEQFSDSSLNLSLRAYVGSLSDRLQTITELHNAIDEKFRASNIVIAFPQLDVHTDPGVGTASAPDLEGGER